MLVSEMKQAVKENGVILWKDEGDARNYDAKFHFDGKLGVFCIRHYDKFHDIYKKGGVTVWAAYPCKTVEQGINATEDYRGFVRAYSEEDWAAL